MSAGDSLLEVGASAPMVVESPCPVRTAVSPGRVGSLLQMDSMIVSNEENDRPVAPEAALEQGVAGERQFRMT
jgi:hypothetical protein